VDTGRWSTSRWPVCDQRTLCAVGRVSGDVDNRLPDVALARHAQEGGHDPSEHVVHRLQRSNRARLYPIAKLCDHPGIKVGVQTGIETLKAKASAVGHRGQLPPSSADFQQLR
jgi:hypothetical protein